jgi:hypothetical protein
MASGDSFIFKGGVIWPADALGMNWYFGNNTYFGVDQTWYDSAGCSAAGYSGWCRPVFDAQGTEPHLSPENYHSMLAVWGSGQTIDNMEFKGMAQLHGTDTSVNGCAGIAGNGYGINVISINYGGPAPHATVKNNYIHGWSHGPVYNKGDCICWSVQHTDCNAWAGGVDKDLIVADSSNFISFYSDVVDYTSQFYDNIVDGSDTTGDMGWNTVSGGWGHVYNNYIAYVQNATIAGNAGYFWGNTYYEIAYTIPDFDVSQHHQVFENIGSPTYFWNNYISHSAGGATLIIYGIDSVNDYIFNNVIIYGNDQINQSSDGALATYVFGNTLHTAHGSSNLYAVASLGPVYAKNNHIMTDSSSFIQTTYGGEATNNVEETPAQALSYFSNAIYPYYPNSNAPSINTGVDLTSYCNLLVDSSPSMPHTDCLKDTTLGVNYDTSTHTVAYPKRTPLSRPQGSAWDIGAYEYETGGGDITPPGVPSGLSVS